MDLRGRSQPVPVQCSAVAKGRSRPKSYRPPILRTLSSAVLEIATFLFFGFLFGGALLAAAYVCAIVAFASSPRTPANSRPEDVRIHSIVAAGDVLTGSPAFRQSADCPPWTQPGRFSPWRQEDGPLRDAARSPEMAPPAAVRRLAARRVKPTQGASRIVARIG